MRAANPLSLQSLVRGLPRAFDDKPLWAQLNITWRCNLDCSYCTEYDNTKGHVPHDEVAARDRQGATSSVCCTRI